LAKKLKDTDYLFISTYLHSRERDLLTAARMERMIEAPTAEEAAKAEAERLKIPRPRPISLEDVVGSTVDAVMEEAKEPLLPSPRRPPVPPATP